MNKVAIVGCGWLSKQVAQALLEKGIRVAGSTTSIAKVAELQRLGISAEVIDLSVATSQNISDFVADADALVVSIPPRSPDYPEMLHRLATSTDRPTILTSSTSVYGQTAGIVTETSQLADTLQARGEQSLPGAAVLRLGGLVGPGRHPVYSLSGRKSLPNPHAPINLVHSQDVVRAIIACLEKNIRSKVINVVAPFHPSRQEYYVAQAIKRGLPPPEFADDAATGKIVQSDCIEPLLGFSPDPALIQ